jgi:subtilisin-like proprotein convertase family protein
VTRVRHFLSPAPGRPQIEGWSRAPTAGAPAASHPSQELAMNLTPCIRRAALVLLLAPASAATGTFPEPPPGSTLTTATFVSPSAVAILDNADVDSLIEVSGLDGTLWDANVVVNIDHPSISDLVVSLIAPNGSIVNLTVRTTFAGLNTTFDDSATVTVQTNQPADHLIAPQRAFAALLGTDPNGTWKLHVSDEVPSNSGYCTWQLEIAAIDGEPSSHTSNDSRADGVAIEANTVLVQRIDLPGSGTVRGVDVVLHVIHNDPSDLRISLEKGGRECLLGLGHGTAPDYFSNAAFDDSAVSLFYLTNPNVPLTSVSPLASLAIFRDLDVAGTWQLRIENVGSQTGSLLGWDLVVEVYDDPLPAAICVGAAPAPCPCGNEGGSSSGCANATHADGATLNVEVEGGGPAHVGGDVRLVARDLDPLQIVLFVQGTESANGGVGVTFGDGLLCTTGQIVRLAARGTGFGTASYPGFFDLPLSIRGGIPAAGGTRVYQALYRSSILFGPCHTGLNATNGVRVPWLPALAHP